MLQLKSIDSNNSVTGKIKLQSKISSMGFKKKKKQTVLFFCSLVESLVYYSNVSCIPCKTGTLSPEEVKVFSVRAQSPLYIAEYFVIIFNFITLFKTNVFFLHNFDSGFFRVF